MVPIKKNSSTEGNPMMAAAQQWWANFSQVPYTILVHVDNARRARNLPEAKNWWEVYEVFNRAFEDPSLGPRFKALKKLPDGTLGKEMWKHFKENGFPLPGEPNGTPIDIILHDLTHLISGYPTDPEGEILVSAFTAGFMNNTTRRSKRSADSKWKLHRMILSTPSFSSSGLLFLDIMEFLYNLIEKNPENREKIMTAYNRGRGMNIDLYDNWDFLAVADIPLDELRRRYNIAPLEE